MRFFVKQAMRMTICRLLGRIVLCGLMTGLWGCTQPEEIQDFFAKKPTEIESKMLIRDVSKVRENPHIYNPLPEMYRTAPRRLMLDDGVRMFYFTKHHSAQIISEDLKRLGYKVSQNPSTNQVIIHADNEDECDLIEEYLRRTDVPPIQVHIDCIILERFADVTKDWETTILIENLFQTSEQITLGQSKYPSPALPGASLRESKRAEFGMDFGFWSRRGVEGKQIRAVIDILESRGYLKILLNPTLETVAGKSATVQIRDRRPVPIRVTERGHDPYFLTRPEWVTDTLTVTPFVYADGSIGLKTAINIGSASKPEGVIQTPIITQRSIDVAENRIEPGKSMIIGGMRRSEDRSVIRGVPFFRDLPLIGAFFSSKDFEQSATEIIFILTPSISSGGVHYTQMADTVREKHRAPDFDPFIDELVHDPLAGDVYVDYVDEKEDEARRETVRLTREAQRADFEAEEDRLRAERAMLEIQAMRAEVEEARARHQEAIARTKAAQAQSEAAIQEARMHQSLISETEEDIQIARQAVEAARAAVEQTQAELKTAQEKTEAAHKETEKVHEELEAVKAEIEALRQKQ